jgi:3-hydroxybutyryl-CoA dehydrogenase
MILEDIGNIAVLGSGIMGHGIAQIFLMGGYPVMLYDIEESILKTAKARIKNSLRLFRKAGLIESPADPSTLDRLRLTIDLEQATEAADFIVEAIPEDLALKQDLFQRVETLCGPDTIIASNTSSLTLKDIGARVKNKKRLVITHWFNPPQLVPTVEVVKGDETIDEVMDITCKLLEKIKKSPVRIHREIPGFLVNRIQTAMAREVLDLYEKGIASAEDIDEAVKGSIGFRLASIGPLLTMDLGGLEIWSKVLENLLPELQHSTKPPKVLKQLVDQGHKGIKSGKGFYDYGLDFSKGELEGVIKKRDQEFLDRLANLYWKTEARDK